VVRPNEVRIEILPHGQGLDLPCRQTDYAAGYDLYSAEESDRIIPPGQRMHIRCGFKMEMNDAYEAQVRPRSGLALKHGVTVLNAPGTIDADYRGEVGVILINHGHEFFRVKRGDRIAQLVFSKPEYPVLTVMPALEASERGESGFGSTG